MENKFEDILPVESNIQPIVDFVEQIMEIPEEHLNDQNVEVISGMFAGGFTEKIRNDSIRELLNNFEELNLTRTEAKKEVNNSKQAIKAIIDELQPSDNKRAILENIFKIFYEIFDTALEQYHGYNIILPIQLEEGATVPTYAHDSDACADLYSQTDITIPPRTMSTMLPTGVHIALPEGWVALIFPRSSIGKNTPLRLSNSVGIIDEEYRGPLGVLYDNVFDSEVKFAAGDRIAQMLVMPSYKFKADIVKTLPTSSRGEGGFGSTGK